MTYKYSKSSADKLKTCDPRLQAVFQAVLKEIDHTIICGHRNQNDQDTAVAQGKSKVNWPNSEHNKTPSRAVDAAPYPINWNDRERFTLFAGYVLGVASSMGVRLRWGGDWDRIYSPKRNRFDDLVHFELDEL